jgi:hypothetical protein
MFSTKPMQKILTVFKWLFLAIGLALIAVGAGARVSPSLANQVEAVNAAINPAEPPWEEFDPYTVEVTEYSEPTTTNIPDRTEGSAARAVPSIWGGGRGLAPAW